MEKKSIVPHSYPRWVRSNCIGKGSFGTVNLAFFVSDRRVFAVKSVNCHSSTTSHLESLENEIETLRTLSSPYVVQYLGDDLTQESGSFTYRNLHMEYLPGGTAADVASQFAGKGLERAVGAYTWCILSALRCVHAKGFVHCDVKGKNVLLGSGPTAGVAKLADFGSAKRFGSDEKTIIPRGSPLWMAPEVIRGERQGPESDVWSLGCTVIEMITGKPAWEDCGADTLCRIALCDTVPDFPSGLSEMGRDFLNNCLRREPSERWTCQHLLEHPFVSVVAVPDSSPRSIFHWSTSEFMDDDDEEEDTEFGFSRTGETDSQTPSSGLGSSVISGRERIKELATDRGVIWESDGWELVRPLYSVCNGEVAGTSMAEADETRPGTNLELCELRNVIEEKTENSPGTSGTLLDLFLDSEGSEGPEGTSTGYLGSVVGPSTCWVIDSEGLSSLRSCPMGGAKGFSSYGVGYVALELLMPRRVEPNSQQD